MPAEKGAKAYAAALRFLTRVTTAASISRTAARATSIITQKYLPPMSVITDIAAGDHCADRVTSPTLPTGISVISLPFSSVQPEKFMPP